MALYTLDELEAELATRIALISSVPFQQDPDPSMVNSWAEFDIPMTAMQHSGLQQHLAFSASVEDAPVVSDAGASEGFLTVLATCVIIFMYRLRSDDQLPDARMAIKAARQVMGAIMAPSAMWGSAIPLTVYKPGAKVGEWLPVEQRYAIRIDISIPPSLTT